MSEIQHTLTQKENARISLAVTVPSNIVADTYKSVVRDIAKKAHIKGFRKGKAPTIVLESKLAPAIKAQTMETVVNDSLSKILKSVDKKPLPYSQPQIQDEFSPDAFETDKEFLFTVEYDSQPTVEVADIQSLTLDEPVVSITDDDIQKELEGIQERNAVMSDKSGAVENGDAVTLTIVEIDETGAEMPGTKRENLTATVGSNQTLYDIDNDIIGLKKDEQKTVTKIFPADYSFSDLAGKKIAVLATITGVKQKNLPDIDDELAQDVNEKHKTLDDLKADLQEQLTGRAAYIVKDMHRKSITDYLVANSKADVPQSAVAYQLKNFWQRFVQNNGNNQDTLLKALADTNQSREDLMETWRGDAEAQVKEQLIIGDLIDKKNITVSDDDVFAEIKKDCEKSGMDFNEVKKYYTKQQNLMPRIKHDMIYKKLFETLKSDITIKKESKPISFTTLVERQSKQKEQLFRNTE